MPLKTVTADKLLASFRFLVHWNGTNLGFSEVSGLKMEIKMIEYREGNFPSPEPFKLPGLHAHSNVVLKRGAAAGDSDFYSWISNPYKSDGSPNYQPVTIMMLGPDITKAPIVQWKLHNAFPISFDGGALKASGNEIVIESLELAVESVKYINKAS